MTLYIKYIFILFSASAYYTFILFSAQHTIHLSYSLPQHTIHLSYSLPQHTIHLSYSLFQGRNRRAAELITEQASYLTWGVAFLCIQSHSLPDQLRAKYCNLIVGTQTQESFQYSLHKHSDKVLTSKHS